MREDDAGSGIPVHDAVQHELDGGSSGVERVVDERAWDAGRRRKRWLPGMDEHDGVAAVELRPDWLERRLAEIFPRIVGEEDHPVGPQRVERVLEFPEGALGIGQRQRREVAETIGPLRDEIRRVFVHATRHPPSLALVPADDARRGQREDPGRDLLRVHEIDRAVGRPLRNHGARGIAACVGRACAQKGGTTC